MDGEFLRSRVGYACEGAPSPWSRVASSSIDSGSSGLEDEGCWGCWELRGRSLGVARVTGSLLFRGLFLVASFLAKRVLVRLLL